MQTNFFHRLDCIDIILQKGPEGLNYTRDILPLLEEPASMIYFFNHISTSDWIPCLLNGDVFANAPVFSFLPKHISKNNLDWFPGLYLRTIAESDETQVQSEICSILQNSLLENGTTYGFVSALVDISVKLKQPYSFKLASRILCELKQIESVDTRLVSKLIEYISCLLDTKHFSCAKEIALELFSTRTNCDKSPKLTSGREKQVFLISDWEYESAVRKFVSTTIPKANYWSFEVVLDLFELVLSRGDDSEMIDHSSLWRPAIKDNRQNIGTGVRNTLLNIVRDIAEDILESASDEEILLMLEGKQRKIYTRIAMYLRTTFPDIDKSGSWKLLLDRTLFDNLECHHEYYHLIRKHFGLAPKHIQNNYLSIVSDGLNTADWIDFRERDKGKQPITQEDFKSWRFWQYSKLIPIAEFLVGSWKDKYDKYLKEFGTQCYPDFTSYIGETWVGPQSPLSEEQIREMGVTEIIAFIKEWSPENERMRPSPEGLSRVLEDTVTDRPGIFIQYIDAFRHLKPVYVRGLLGGFRKGIKDGRVIDWNVLLEFCLWLIKQPKTNDRSVIEADEDGDCTWFRKEIVGLISEGLKPGETTIPSEYRNHVWNILDTLLDDPDPLDSYRKPNNNREDPYFTAINSVRSSALSTAIRYGIWVMNFTDKLDSLHKTTLLDMPELKIRLERHLDLRCERSVAVHSIYGYWFPWLCLFSEKWAENVTRKVFRINTVHQGLFEAAWKAYIAYQPLYTQPFLLLQNQYKRAIENLHELEGTLNRAEEGLIEHIMMAYIRGDLDTFRNRELLDSLFDLHSENIREYALKYVSSVVSHPESVISHEMISRIKSLFEIRIAAALSSNDPIHYNNEMKAFQQWFTLPFDDKWVLETLQITFCLRSSIRADYSVVERLLELADSHPLNVVQCLEQMVKKNEWGFGGHFKKLRKILIIVLENELSRPIAKLTINMLGSMGYIELRDLVQKKA